jgi:hypothetical protein
MHGTATGSAIGLGTWGLGHLMGTPGANESAVVAGLFSGIPLALAGKNIGRAAYYNPVTQGYLKRQGILPPATRSGWTSAPDKEALIRALAQKGSLNQGPAPSQ